MAGVVLIKIAGCGLSEDLTLPETTTLAELRTLIAKKLHAMPGGIKLLCKGKVLKDDQLQLKSELHVVDNSKVLVVKSPQEISRQQEEQKIAKASRFARLTEAVKEIAKRTDDGNSEDYYFELENQDGNKLEIPKENRQLLTQGVTMAMKGQALLKSKQWDDALVVLELADESFAQCDHRYTSMVDNVPVVALDIVWAMFQKRDLSRLHEAREWLKRAEDGFVRVHGPNLERVKTLRQGFIPERALYVRLYLLKAVVAHHLGFYVDASTFIDRARQENALLKVDDQDLSYLLSMQFSLKEARRALRAHPGNQGAAAAYAVNQRLKAEELLEQKRKEREDKREALRYGKNQNGSLINIHLLRALRNMGFPNDLAVEALRQYNNDQSLTIGALTDPSQRQALEGAVEATQLARLARPTISRSLDADIATLTALGFDARLARFALISTKGDMNQAAIMCSSTDIDDIVDDDRGLPEIYCATNAMEVDNPSRSLRSLDTTQSPSSSSSSSATVEVNARQEEEEKKRLEANAVKKRKLDEDIESELVNDFEKDAEDYLDINLDAESEAIEEYTLLIRQRSDSVPRRDPNTWIDS
jgi:galactitol-specific phosphotransferase system IIB component